jgi:hypothetical protein
MFQRNILLPSSRSKRKQQAETGKHVIPGWELQRTNEGKNRPNSACYFLLAGGLLSLFFNSEDGGSMFLRNIGRLVLDYMVSHPIRQCGSILRMNSHRT